MKLTETHVVLQWSYLGIYQMQQYPLCYQQATQKSSWALIRSWLAFITKKHSVHQHSQLAEISVILKTSSLKYLHRGVHVSFSTAISAINFRHHDY